MKSIAVVGSGISGLTAAYLLSRRYRVTLFERDARLGGHTHTIVVPTPGGSLGGSLALDTGFLVYNEHTYPHLTRLFGELGVATDDSDMSFSVCCHSTDFEYSSRGAAGFFAQRTRLFSRTHLVLLGEIFRFNRIARRAVDLLDDRQTLGEFLSVHRFAPVFVERYVVPMTAAIWSMSPRAVREFPVATLLRFLSNHGLLAVNGQPRWKVVRGGSHTYVPLLAAPLADRCVTSTEVMQVARTPDGVSVVCRGRASASFDHVVLACHGPQALSLLSQPTMAERRVFSAFTTTSNDAVLHTDARVLPRRPAARASWNFSLDGDPTAPPSLTYHLNRLQGLTTTEQYCVSLNPTQRLDESRVIARLRYSHPLYTRAAVTAQQQWADVSGVDRIHYCGAYWYYGFHEDGVRSAMRVARALGVEW